MWCALCAGAPKGNGLERSRGAQEGHPGVERRAQPHSSKQFAEPGRPENQTPQDHGGMRQLVSAQTGFGLL